LARLFFKATATTMAYNNEQNGDNNKQHNKKIGDKRIEPKQ